MSKLTIKLKGLFKNDLKLRDIDSATISFNRMRKVIGILGVALPFALYLGCFFFGESTFGFDFNHAKIALQPSISHYFNTNMREVFTGTMCAVSLF